MLQGFWKVFVGFGRVCSAFLWFYSVDKGGGGPLMMATKALARLLLGFDGLRTLGGGGGGEGLRC